MLAAVALPAAPAFDAPSAQWQAYGAALGAYALAHELGEGFALPGVPELVVCSRSWPKGSSADAAVKVAAGDYASLNAALGIPSGVVASGDGRYANPAAWCGCDPAAEIVYYARFSALGQEAHGWICGRCRMLVQSG